jgi:hypothetical protein
VEFLKLRRPLHFLMMEAETVSKPLKTCCILTRLIAGEDNIAFSRRKIFRSSVEMTRLRVNGVVVTFL